MECHCALLSSCAALVSHKVGCRVVYALHSSYIYDETWLTFKVILPVSHFPRRLIRPTFNLSFLKLAHL